MKWETHDVDFAILLFREGIKTRDVVRLLGTRPEAIYYALNLRGLSVKELRKMSPLPQEDRSRIIQEFCATKTDLGETNLEELRLMLELYGLSLEGFIAQPFKRLSESTELLEPHADFVFLLIRDGIGIRNVAKVFSATVGDVRFFLRSHGILLTELRKMPPLPQDDRSSVIQGFCAKESNLGNLRLVLDTYNIRYDDFVDHSIRTHIERGFYETTKSTQKAFTERNAEIVELRRQGKKLDDIAGQYGITRERVRQIVLRYNRTSDNPVDIGEVTKLIRQPTPEQLKQWAKIVELRQSGMSYQEIADTIGIKRNAVAQCIRTYNDSVELPWKVPVEDNRYIISDEVREGIIRERENGAIVSAITKQFGVSAITVNRVLKEVGLTRPLLSARDKEIAELALQGKSLTVIAKHLNITHAQVCRAVRRYNRVSDNPIPLTQRLTPLELQERREKILELARSGLTYQEIADVLEIEKHVVSRWILQYNSTAEHPVKIAKKNEETSDEVKSGVIQERKKGTTIAEIAKKFEISTTTVNSLLKKAGLTDPPQSLHDTLSDRDKEIAELFRQGKTLVEIAEHFGLAHTQVQHVLYRYNRISGVPIPIELFSADQQLLEKMVELARSGSTYQEIADALGAKKNKVYAWINRYNSTAEHPVKVRKEKKPAVDEGVRNGIIRERKKRTIIPVIAKQFGVSISSVNQVLKEAGLIRHQEKRAPITDEMRNGIIQEYKNGATISAITKQLGISVTTVREVLKKAGLFRPTQSLRNVLSDRDKEIAELRRQGKTLAAIAEHYDIQTSTVKFAVERYNKLSDDPVPAVLLRGAKLVERQEKVIELARSGLTCQEIADTFGLSGDYVARLINKYNRTAERPIKVRKGQELTIGNEVRDAIIRERDEGATVAAMAEQFGVSRTAVRNVLRRAELPCPDISDRDKEIAELRRQGKKLADIGKEYGLTSSQVCHAVARYNKTTDDPIPMSAPPTAQQMTERMKKIAEMGRSGMTYQQIADALGLRKRYLQGLVLEYNRTAEHPVNVLSENEVKINDEVRSGFIRERRMGKSLTAIAKQFGVSRTVVGNVLKKAGLLYPFLSDRDKEIVELSRQGKTLTEIAEHFGLTSDQVYDALQRHIRESDEHLVEQRQAEQREKMAKLARSGSTYQEIADVLGLKRSFVYKQIYEYNRTAEHPVEVRKPDRPRTSDKVRNAIIRERKKGTTIAEIVKKSGVSTGTVKTVIKKAGLTRPQEKQAPLSDEIRNEIIQERNKGMTTLAIAEQLGITNDQVRGVLKKAGLVRPQESYCNVLSDQDKEIAELRRQGKALSDIARHYGLKHSQVYGILRRFNKISDDPVPLADRVLTEKQLELQKKMVELVRSGLTRQQIADALGISIAAVYSWINRYNRTAERPLKVRREEQTKKIDNEVKEGIIRERDKGATLAAMAKQFGVSRKTVSNVLSNAGLAHSHLPDNDKEIRKKEIKNESRVDIQEEVTEIKQEEVPQCCLDNSIIDNGCSGDVATKPPVKDTADDLARKFWNKDHRAVDMLLDPKDFSSEEVVKLINEALLYAYEQFGE